MKINTREDPSTKRMLTNTLPMEPFAGEGDQRYYYHPAFHVPIFADITANHESIIVRLSTDTVQLVVDGGRFFEFRLLFDRLWWFPGGLIAARRFFRIFVRAHFLRCDGRKQ